MTTSSNRKVDKVLMGDELESQIRHHCYKVVHYLDLTEEFIQWN